MAPRTPVVINRTYGYEEEIPSTDVLAIPGALLGGQIDMATHRSVNVGEPVSLQDAATKNYVDAQIAALSLLSGRTSPMVVGVLAFDSSSPMLLKTLFAGQIIDGFRLLITTPFDGTPSISVGTAADPTALLAPSDVLLGTSGSYETDEVITVDVPEHLMLNFIRGGATHGSALFVFFVT